MKNNLKALRLVEFGLKPSNVSKLNESEINEIYSKLISEQASSTKGVTSISSKNPNAATIAKNLNSQGVNVNMTETDSEDMSEKSPFRICTSQMGKEFGTKKRSKWNSKQMAKYEKCVKDVKKSLKEGKSPLSLYFENEIMKIVESNIPPRMTKGQLLRYILEDTKTKPKESPTKDPKEKEKPGKKPNNPFKPSPHKQPKPKAHKEETKEAVMDAPAKPKTKPGTKPVTKPGQKPGTPFRPAPHKQPKPKAKLPEWLKFNNMGIRFKK